MPWTQGEFKVPHNFVTEYNAGQKKIRADLVDENFTDIGNAINKVVDDYSEYEAALKAEVDGKLRDFEETLPVAATEKPLANAKEAEVGTSEKYAREDHVHPMLVIEKYEICEFYDFRHPFLKKGFVPRYGTLIQNAATLYPAAWEYLQTAEGQMLCKTESEWQALSTATYYTNSSGTKEGWNGIGGVPWFVQDLGAGTLRVPDTRGMHSENAGATGFLDVGAVSHDMIRNITGTIGRVVNDGVSGVFTATSRDGIEREDMEYGASRIAMNVSRSVPTGKVVRPRSFGILPTVYLGE